MIDKSKVDYSVLAGPFGVWRDSISYSIEAAQDAISMGLEDALNFAMTTSHYRELGLSENDVEILMEFFKFEFKPEPDTFSLSQNDFLPKRKYLMRVTRK